LFRRAGATASSLALPTAPYQPSAENLKAREWFKDEKFGLFVH
jgi:hypothetical protein